MGLRSIQVSAKELSELIAMIYAGAEDPRRWDACLARIGALVHAHTVNFIFNSRQDQAHNIALSIGQAADGVSKYNEHWRHYDVWLRHSAPELEQPGAVFTSQALAADATVLSSPIYNEFYRGMGIFYGLLSTLLADQHRASLLSANFDYATGPPDASRRELFELLSPHFQQAIALHEQLRGQDSGSAGFQAFLDRSPVGFALVGADGKLQRTNRAFDSIVESNDGLHRKASRLVFDDSRAGSAYLAALRDAAAATQRKGSGSGGAIRIPRPSERADYELVVSPLSDEGSLFDVGQTRAALLLADPAAEPAGLAEVLASEYGMTPREAQLTVRIIAGAEPADLAAEFDITRNTLAFHMKNIYAKAGVRGRAELVRVLSRGLAAWR